MTMNAQSVFTRHGEWIGDIIATLITLITDTEGVWHGADVDGNLSTLIEDMEAAADALYDGGHESIEAEIKAFRKCAKPIKGATPDDAVGYVHAMDDRDGRDEQILALACVKVFYACTNRDVAELADMRAELWLSPSEQTELGTIVRALYRALDARWARRVRPSGGQATIKGDAVKAVEVGAHEYVKVDGSRRCGSCDRGRTAKVHTAAVVPAEIDAAPVATDAPIVGCAEVIDTDVRSWHVAVEPSIAPVADDVVDAPEPVVALAETFRAHMGATVRLTVKVRTRQVLRELPNDETGIEYVDDFRDHVGEITDVRVSGSSVEVTLTDDVPQDHIVLVSAGIAAIGAPADEYRLTVIAAEPAVSAVELVGLVVTSADDVKLISGTPVVANGARFGYVASAKRLHGVDGFNLMTGGAYTTHYATRQVAPAVIGATVCPQPFPTCPCAGMTHVSAAELRKLPRLVTDVPAGTADQGSPVAEPAEDVSVPASPVVVPAETSEPTDVPETEDAAMADPVRALIAAGTWSSVLLGKRGQREGFDALALPDGRLGRETYTAVAGQLAAFGGRWNKEAKGFVFHRSYSTFRNEHIAGGRERVAEWLAAGEPAVSVPDVAPVDVVDVVDVVDDVPAKVDALGNVCRPFAVPADCLDALPAGYAAALIGEGVRVHAAAIGSAVTLDGCAVTDLVDVARVPVDCKTCVAAMRAVGAASVVEVVADAAPVDDAPMVGHVAGIGEVHTSDGPRGYTWCALVAPLPDGHSSFTVPTAPFRARFAELITCPGCAHVLACQSDGCAECARVTGGAEDAADHDDSAYRPDAGVFVDDVQVMSVRRIDLTATVGKPCGECGEDVAVEPHGAGCSADPDAVAVPGSRVEAEANAAALAAELRSDAAPARECRTDVRSPRVESAPVADVALVEAAPEVVEDGSNPHAQVVEVLGRGPVNGYRWHLSAGARTKQLGKAVRQALASARVELGGLFTVTAPIGSRAVNVVPAVGHVVTDWAPVFAAVAGVLAGSLADASCGCDRSADLVGSDA